MEQLSPADINDIASGVANNQNLISAIATRIQEAIRPPSESGQSSGTQSTTTQVANQPQDNTNLTADRATQRDQDLPGTSRQDLLLTSQGWYKG